VAWRICSVTLSVIPRAPDTKIAAYKSSRGWRFDWYSSYGSDFNYDFHASLDPAVALPVFSYEPQQGKADRAEGEVPGFSCFRAGSPSRTVQIRR
jgi:predicted dithiol-disulfide oxidoreductase (DUF899 family)